MVAIDESFPKSGFNYRAIVPELESKHPDVRIVVISDPIGSEAAWARGVSSMVSRRDALYKGGLAKSVEEALKA